MYFVTRAFGERKRGKEWFRIRTQLSRILNWTFALVRSRRINRNTLIPQLHRRRKCRWPNRGGWTRLWSRRRNIGSREILSILYNELRLEGTDSYKIYPLNEFSRDSKQSSRAWCFFFVLKGQLSTACRHSPFQHYLLLNYLFT